MMSPVTTQEIIDTLKHIIANDLDVNVRAQDISDVDPLFEDGIGLDSIAIVEFIRLIEERFGCSFGEDALTMELFKDLQTLAQFIAARGVSGKEHGND